MDRRSIRLSLSRATLVLLATAAIPAEESTPAPPPVAVGLDALIRFDAASHFDVASQVIENDRHPRRALSRLRPDVTFTPGGPVSGYVQAQWYGSADHGVRSLASVYQAYADIAAGSVRVRAGRQELAFGSGFILGADTFYDGASYDAVNVTFEPGARLHVDVYGGRYVSDNTPGTSGSLAGVHARWGDPERAALEFLAVRDTGAGDDGGSSLRGDHRDSYGLRAVFQRGPVALEIEPVRQAGRTGGRPIAAWGGHADVTYAPTGGGKRAPRFRTSYAWASGDSRSGDGTSTGFRNPNNDAVHVGDAGVFGELGNFSIGEATASGLTAFAIGAEISLGEHTRASATLHRFRAREVAGATSHALGRELDIVVTRQLADGLALTASIDRFESAGFFRDALGHHQDVTYAYLALEISLW